MCAFYYDEQKIKKGDEAIYKNENITILSAKHIKENKTMNILYVKNDLQENQIIVPYKTLIPDIKLIKRI